MSFLEIRFPEDVSALAQGGVQFSTHVTRLASGRERRVLNWSQPLDRFFISTVVMDDPARYRLVRDFFYMVRGRASGFRFFDHGDNEAEMAPIGTADGMLVEFQLANVYGQGASAFTRIIHKPIHQESVAGANRAVRIYVDGAEVQSGWSVDPTTGVVTFDAPPASGTVSWSGHFDKPVRFETDLFNPNLETPTLHDVGIELVGYRVG
jgi:uncharacterized protein (TIGR02217 family)